MESKYMIASRYLFLDMAIKVLEQDLQHIKNGSFKLKEPYVESIQIMISKAIQERRKLKRIMIQNKISIHFICSEGNFTSYRFYLSGRVKEASYFNTVIKKNVEGIIRDLMK